MDPIPPPQQSILPPQPVAPATPPKKYPGIIISIFLLFLGITVGIIFDKTTFLSAVPTPTPTPTPTPPITLTPSIPSSRATVTIDPITGWKIYTNPKIGISLNYPPDYDSDENETTVEPDKVYISYVSNQPITKPLQIRDATQTSIEIRRMTKNFYNYIGDVGTAGTFTPTTLQKTTLTVGGATATKYSGDWTSYFAVTGHHITIIIKKENDVFQIDSYPTLGIPEAVFNQILSTFKFLNTSTSKQVLGIQLTQCCSCPIMVPASQIGKDGWVVYEQGKNYFPQLPEACSAPNIGACAPCPPLEAQSYTCPPTGWVDCMPILTPEAQAACSAEAITWYKANCPDFNGVAQ